MLVSGPASLSALSTPTWACRSGSAIAQAAASADPPVSWPGPGHPPPARPGPGQSAPAPAGPDRLADRAEAAADAISHPEPRARALAGLASAAAVTGDPSWALTLAGLAETAAGTIANLGRQAQILPDIARDAVNGLMPSWLTRLISVDFVGKFGG